MGATFDEKRNKFIARATINGKRTYLGQFDTRAEAEYVVLQNTPSLLSTYRVGYFKDDVSLGWLAPFRRLKALRLKKLAAKKQAQEAANKIKSL